MKKILMVLLAITFILPAMIGQISYAASAEDATISGKVVETMDSGGYTYVCVEKKGKKNMVSYATDQDSQRQEHVLLSRI